MLHYFLKKSVKSRYTVSMYARTSSHDTGRLPPTPEKRVDYWVER